MFSRVATRFAPLVTCTLLAAQKPAPPPDVLAVEKEIVQALVGFARHAETYKAPSRARSVYATILAYYDTDNASARAGLGYKRVKDEWQQVTPPDKLPADSANPQQRDTVAKAWRPAAMRAGKLHRELGIALSSARFFGIDVPTPGELVAWYDTVTEPTGAHRPHAGGAKDGRDVAAPTAAALFARFFCQQDPSKTPIMKAAADLLLAVADPQDPVACYWTTYALFQTGGRHWAEWQKRVDDKVVRGQVRDGDLRGSWQPAGGASRVRTAALNVLTLEAYYRYTRLVR